MSDETAPATPAKQQTDADVLDPVDDLQAQIHGLHDRIDGLGANLDKILAAVSPEPTVEAEPDPAAMMLPEGTTRFVSVQASDFQIILKHRGWVNVGEGRNELIPQKLLVFSNHICTTDDAELIELARAYIKKRGAGEFFEDPHAQPQSGIQITTGARDTSAPVANPEQPALAVRN